MSLLNKLFHRRSMSISSQAFSPYFTVNGGKAFYPTTVNASTALSNSDIFAIVSRISSNIAALKFKSDNPQITKSLSQPSQLINGFSFWQKVVVQMLLTGNSYVLIEPQDDQSFQLVHIPANNVSINILSKAAGDEADGIFYTVHVQEDNDKTYTVPSSQMLHFRCLVSGSDAQTNGYCGISPLVSLAREAAIQEQSNKLAVDALGHAITPSYVLSIPTTRVDEDAKENFRSNFEKMVSGDNAGRAIVLDQSMSVEPLQVNPNIDKLLSNTTFSQNQIAKAFNIPSDYLNGQGNQQSSISEMTSLYVNALSLYINPIISELEAKLDTDISADFSVLADVDHQQLINNVSTLAKNGTMPAAVALTLLKNVNALGLGELSNDYIARALKEEQNLTLKGGEKDEQDQQES